MNLKKENNFGNFYSISGILGDDNDLSKNMICFVLKSDLLFVENIEDFNLFTKRINIKFNGKVIEMDDNLSYLNQSKGIILNTLMNGKNIGLFESSGTACFRDPGFELVNFIYSIRTKFDIKIFPIPGTGALNTAISVSGFYMNKYIFLDGISINTKNELNKYDIPIIYFNHFNLFSELYDSICFMKNEKERKCFIGINLGKKFVLYENLLLRGICNEVFEDFNNIFNNNSKLPDLVFIFDKK